MAFKRICLPMLGQALLIHALVQEPTPFAQAYAVAEPAVTPPSQLRLPTRTFKHKRANIFSEAQGGIESVLSAIGNAPSYVASGIPELYENIPSGTAVQSSLSLDDAAVSALPTQVNNFGPYANWTDQGWNVRFHGNIYRQPNTSQQTLDSLANDFLIGTSIQSLPPAEASQARNVTAEIFIIQDGNATAPVFTLEPPASAAASGQQGGPGAQTVQYPFQVTAEGDFDDFVPILSNGLAAGNQTNLVQRLNVNTQGSDLGNATAYLLPPTGLTVISDIDDILRVTQIWSPKNIILNTFANPYVPWDDMPTVYANWSQNLNISNSQTSFHYLTTLPEQVTRNYEQFIFANYPPGSFDTRPLNFSDVSATLSIRKFLMDKMFQSFPHRKFILVGDVSNSDIMRDYPQMVMDYPNQVQCIFLRNTSATDPTFDFPFDTSGFRSLDNNQYMFFVTPADLMGLDIANGHCRNASVPQNTTFGLQLPKGYGAAAASAADSGTGGMPTATGTSHGVRAAVGKGAVAMAAVVGVVGWLAV